MKTNKNFNTPKIGEGIFLVRDVAEILHLPYPKVRYWLKEYWDSLFGNYSCGDKGNKAINFYTLIEFCTFYELRKKGVSVHKIKEAHKAIGKQYDTLYPFARKGISTDGKAIWVDYLENIIKVDGKLQIDIKKILEPYLHKIDYGKNQIAERYYPIGKTHSVVVDPNHQFGQPIITGTNIKTQTIIQLINGGESKKSITLLYNLTSKQVNDALQYYNRAA